ncbi:hypothetical protein L210DRAFT_3545282 [Boletus edulis BED1]|uniref:Uncharacterized protein n=1 Tax=Boletus edulis BED1 TaxID=1328754 RepID=A0AAD4BR57_BOLED|nr:hypothetical protein L210DRAFT_3545282 [Boletus edulis BED1]
MSERTSFRLPGHDLNPFAEKKCLLSLLAAYSRQWNPRNLEAPWYEPWSQIFADLVTRHPSLSVAPQPYLWYDPTSEPHTTPGPAHLLSTHDEQLDDVQDDVGNTTLDSVRSSSVPSHRNRSRIPDFAITRKVSFLRPDNFSQVLHLDRRVTYLGLPLLAELKVSGARCHDIQTSLLNAIKPMTLARDQLFKQASHLFQMYPHQESVILVAISGFWWSYFIYPRALSEKFGPPPKDDDNEEEEEEDLDLEHDIRLPSQNGIHDALTQDPLTASNSSETPIQVLQEHLYGFPLSALQDNPESPAHFHTVLPQGRVMLHENGWSDYLLYGTAPSNQVLSLILDRLHSVVHVHYDGRMG